MECGNHDGKNRGVSVAYLKGGDVAKCMERQIEEFLDEKA